MPDVTVRGEGVHDLRELTVKIKKASPQLRRELRRRLADQADPLARKVRESILDMRTEHSSDGTLRGEVAHTVDVSVSYPASGVRVEIVSRGTWMPPGMENLPAYLDRVRGWSHPVFARPGRERTWARQRGKPGWFQRPVIAEWAHLQQDVQAAINEVKQELER